ncbi:hypothetical protein F4777DRAFT_540550 [Nemania sp. FL0916]|nr:hypothetical protein F4777DRAFT_540550 [Nemania sp. FL0916]
MKRSISMPIATLLAAYTAFYGSVASKSFESIQFPSRSFFQRQQLIVVVLSDTNQHSPRRSEANPLPNDLRRSNTRITATFTFAHVHSNLGLPLYEV